MKRFLALILAALLLCAPALAWETESPEAAEELYAMPKPRRVVIDEVPGRLFADIPYCGENSRDTEILHIVLPEEGEGPFPVIVSVHGGAWSSGNTSKKHEVSATQYAAFAGLKRGYAVVCVDYSVKNTSNPVAFPLQIQEIRTAVRFVRSVAGQYNFDPDHICLLGESAGGMLVSMAALTGGEDYYDNPELGSMDWSAEVQAVIAQYPAPKMGRNGMTARLYDVEEDALTDEMLSRITALDHIDANDPPFFIEHGTADTTIPYTDSIEFYEALTAAGIKDCELHIYEGFEHAVAWFQSDYVTEQHFNWLDKQFGR